MEWISVNERLPEPEKEVLVYYSGHNRHGVTTAMYENGTVHTDDSEWIWWDHDFDYCEETDDFIIPEGWFEYRHFNPDDLYNNCVDIPVTHWMPLPEPPINEG